MIWVAALVSLPFLWVLARQRTLRRLALRSAARRPIEAALVVAGSLLGTAIITGSLIVGDTIDRSIRAAAYDQLGPIDETVSVNGLDAGAALVARFAGFSSPDVDGVLSFVTAGASVVSARPGGSSQPRAQLLEVDFAAARRFGPDSAIVGLTGDTPAAGHAAVTVDLSSRLGLKPGDSITVYAYGREVPMVVDRIVPRRGVAGYWTIDGRQQAYNVIVPPGTIATIAQGASAETGGLVPPEVIVGISNVGGVESGAARTEAVRAAADEVAKPLGVRAVAAKKDLLDLANRSAKSLSDFYFTIGMFAVAAGIMLLVNIFVMLADERRSELGMLRAVGLRRAPLVGAFALEGWIYSLLSSAIGAVAGIGVGRLIAWRADTILEGGQETTALHMVFTFTRGTVLAGFAFGFLISLVTIVITSVRIAHFNVIRAIRDVQEPPRVRPRRRYALTGLVLAVVGVALSIVGFGAPNGYGIMAGPAFAAVGLAPQLARRWPTRKVTTVTATAVLVWTVLAIPVIGWLGESVVIPIFLVQGLLLSAAAIALVNVFQASIGRSLARLTGRSLSVRLGLAYPLARRFRTAMTLGMFSIVMLTLVYMSVISAMFRGQTNRLAAKIGGGFNIIATSNPTNPPAGSELTSLDGVDSVAPLAYVFADFTRANDPAQTWPVTGFGPELLAQPPVLSERGTYDSDVAAWTAVHDDPSLIIVDDNFLTSAGGPNSKPAKIGDHVTIVDPQSGQQRNLTVAAKSQDDIFANGVFVGIDGLRSLFGPRAVPSRFFIASSSADATVSAIRARYIGNGADASTISSLVHSALAQNSAFFTLMQQFVGVGLLVGIAGIGVIMIRAVRERRREVGVLRSLGFTARAVSKVLVLEAGFVALEGILIGVVIALVASYFFGATGADWAKGLTWSVPIREVLFIVAVALVATLAASLWPARRASDIRPAAALRIAD